METNNRGGGGCGSAVVGDLARRSVSRRSLASLGGPCRNNRVDVGDVGRGARAALGAVPGRQSYFESRAFGRGGGIAAGFDWMDRGRSTCERLACPGLGSVRRRPAGAAARRKMR